MYLAGLGRKIDAYVNAQDLPGQISLWCILLSVTYFCMESQTRCQHSIRPFTYKRDRGELPEI